MFGVPVFATPRFVSASNSPSGTRQRNDPVSRSIAASMPQGGFWHGYPCESVKNSYLRARSAQGNAAPSRVFTMPEQPAHVHRVDEQQVRLFGSKDAPP